MHLQIPVRSILLSPPCPRPFLLWFAIHALYPVLVYVSPAALR